MTPPPEPMIKLEPGGTAPILSYNVPEPTSYTGRHVIEMDFAADVFSAAALKIPALPSAPPPAAPPVTFRQPEVLRATDIGRTGGADARRRVDAAAELHGANGRGA